MSGNQKAPPHVPVLTEVVELTEDQTAAAGESSPEAFPELTDEVDLSLLSTDAYAVTAPAGLDELPAGAEASAEAAATGPLESSSTQIPAPVPAPAPVLDENLLTQRVLVDLSRQLDLMFEQRLRESLTPMLTRMTDTLMREMRNQLAISLREMVTRAVSLELDKIQKRRQG